jgi:transposase
MGSGKPLTEHKKGQIDALSSEGHSKRYIAKSVGCSRTAVTNYVKDRINYGKRHLHGRPRKLNARDERRLCRAAAPGNLSSAKLVKQLNLPVSRRTVSRALNDSGICSM